MSILLFPELSDGHFEVGGVQITLPTSGASFSGWRWGLVCTHETLKATVKKYL